MTNGNAAPSAPCGNDDQWERVAFLAGRLAADAGLTRDANPHPIGSRSAQGWLSGWQSGGRSAARARAAVARLPVARPGRGDGGLVIAMIDRLPGMGADDLHTLAINAEQQARSGVPEKRASAQALLCAIRAEAADRQDGRKADTVTTAPNGAAMRPPATARLA